MLPKLIFISLVTAAVCKNIQTQNFSSTLPPSSSHPPLDASFPPVSSTHTLSDSNYLTTASTLLPPSSTHLPLSSPSPNNEKQAVINQIFTNPLANSTLSVVDKNHPRPSTFVPEVVTSKPDDVEALLDAVFGNSTGPVIKPTDSDPPRGPEDPGEDYLGGIDLHYDALIEPKPVSTNEPQDLSCSTPEGVAGDCVPYYLCNNTDEVAVIDIGLNVTSTLLSEMDYGFTVIMSLAMYPFDPRTQVFLFWGTELQLSDRDVPCASYLDTCCQAADKLDKPVTPKPDPKREGCGWRNANGTIIASLASGKGETEFAEFPWMCAILKVEPMTDNSPEKVPQYKYIGGGSLIHPSVVLTAAHYVASSPQLRVRAGEWDTQSIKEPHPYQDREVASVVTHQDFNKGNLFYDIAVLFLSQPMKLAPNVGLACLPPPRQRVPGGTRCFATGWGMDKFGKEGRYQVILKKVEVPVVEGAQCQTALRQTRLGRFFELHTSFMCAGGEEGKDTCKGDGGSPLSCPIESQEGRYMQSGIVAWGIGCNEEGTPGVYVDVATLRSWVDDIVAGKGYDPKIYSF